MNSNAFLLSLTFSAALGLATATSGQAPSPPLVIEGKAFRIGMPRTEAMALLAECCIVDLDRAGESAFIRSKSSPPGRSIVGAIFFRDGRVTGLRRDVVQSQNREAAEFFLALYRSLLNGQNKMSGSVTITANPVDGANFTGRELVFRFPDGRYVTVQHSFGDDGIVVVDLSEER
jgi:hypothetical protein